VASSTLGSWWGYSCRRRRQRRSYCRRCRRKRHISHRRRSRTPGACLSPPSTSLGSPRELRVRPTCSRALGSPWRRGRLPGASTSLGSASAWQAELCPPHQTSLASRLALRGHQWELQPRLSFDKFRPRLPWAAAATRAERDPRSTRAWRQCTLRLREPRTYRLRRHLPHAPSRSSRCYTSWHQPCAHNHRHSRLRQHLPARGRRTAAARLRSLTRLQPLPSDVIRQVRAPKRARRPTWMRRRRAKERSLRCGRGVRRLKSSRGNSMRSCNLCWKQRGQGRRRTRTERPRSTTVGKRPTLRCTKRRTPDSGLRTRPSGQ